MTSRAFFGNMRIVFESGDNMLFPDQSVIISTGRRKESGGDRSGGKKPALNLR
jgi:hypothetical protein